MTFIYVIYCPKCDKYFKPEVRRGKPSDCEVCGSERKWKGVEKFGPDDPYIKEEFYNITYNENIRVSRSLGVTPEQLNDAMKRSPGTEWKKVGNSYCPVIHNRPEKLKIMKQFGFEEFPANLHEQRVAKGMK